MRVLLDENLHRKLKLSFDPSVEVMTVTERGWNGKRKRRFAPSSATGI